ncbi:hypothetical protein QEN19_003042 [Hanseniaspora menglaensis]
MSSETQPNKHSILSDILAVDTRLKSNYNEKKTNLKNSEDLHDIDILDEDSVDSILIYQLTENELLLKESDLNGQAYDSAIDYLFACFKRLHLNRIDARNSGVINLDYFQIERLILNYTIVILQLNEFTIHGDKKTIIKSLIKWNSYDLPDFTVFIQKILQFSKENDDLLSVANAISGGLIIFYKAEGLLLQGKCKKMMDVTTPISALAINFVEEQTRILETGLRLFQTLINQSLFMEVFLHLGTFDPLNLLEKGLSNDSKVKKEINVMEKYSILGVLLSTDISSYLNPLISKAIYKPFVMYEEEHFRQERYIYDELKEINRTLKSTHINTLNLLFEIVDKIIRHSKNTRQVVLKWFATLLNYNKLRTSEHQDPDTLGYCSDALMINISLLFMKFSSHFIENKFDKIDIDYILQKHTLNLQFEDETRMNSEISDWNVACQKNENNGYEANFITECFFLCSSYFYYGIGGAIVRDSLEERKCKAIKDALEKMEEAVEKQKNNPFAIKFIEAKKVKIEQDYTSSKAKRMAFESFLLNQDISNDIFTFVGGTCKFLLRSIDPLHLYPSKLFKNPLMNENDAEFIEKHDDQTYLRQKAPSPFKYYPISIIEGILKYSNVMVRFVYSPLREHWMLQNFIDFTTVILRNNELLSNPHLKSDMVSIMAICSAEQKNHTDATEWYIDEAKPGFMINEIISNPTASEHLLYGLLDFYIQIEKTGGSNEFYDKFNSRYYISMILEQLYKIPHFKQQLINLALGSKNHKFFTTLIARMLNDLTFLLDESFAGLSEVHNCYVELQKRIRGEPASNDESMEDLRSRLNKAASRAESCCGLANLSMGLFRILTRDIPQCFTIPELVDRLASMLNYNLNMLVGPQCKNLVVKNPQKYKFDPKTLLKDLCSIYINLSNEEAFITAAARDDRSFDPNLFEQAIRNLHNRLRIVDTEFAENIRDFVRNVQEEKLIFEQMDVDMSDCPDEFLDPLMYIVMDDPVILPKSRISIDKKTIQQHLLNDPTDPFNRTPLKFEEVIPDVELKAKIDAYKREKSRHR